MTVEIPENSVRAKCGAATPCRLPMHFRMDAVHTKACRGYFSCRSGNVRVVEVVQHDSGA